MKKIIPIVLVGVLVISGLGAVALSDSDTEKIMKIDNINISEPTIIDSGEYISIDFEESTSKLLLTGNPITNVITKTYTFPVGTKISNVNVNYDIEKYVLSKKIQTIASR